MIDEAMGGGETEAFLDADLVIKGLSLGEIAEIKREAPSIFHRVRALLFTDQLLGAEQRKLRMIGLMRGPL